MTILSSIIMFNTKILEQYFKDINRFVLSVIIYYMNNFLWLGKSEKIPVLISIWVLLIILIISNSVIF